MTNHQRHFSNTLHSAASHLPTKPPESTVFLSPPPVHNAEHSCTSEPHRREVHSGIRSPLQVYIHYPARQNLSPFTTICSTCFGELLSRTQARAQEVSSTFGDLLYTSPYAEMNPLRKYRLWKARNVKERNARKRGGGGQEGQGVSVHGVQQPPERTSLTHLESSYLKNKHGK